VKRKSRPQSPAWGGGESRSGKNQEVAGSTPATGTILNYLADIPLKSVSTSR